MKSFLITITFLFAVVVHSQIDTRILIKGKINVSAEGDSSDINVYNTATTQGTVTNEYGEFLIPVSVNDKLIFSGIQYQEFAVVIDEGVVESKKLNINLTESVTVLDEVTVRPYNMSGDVVVDVARIKTADIDRVPGNTLGIVQTYDYEFRPDEQTVPENDAIDVHYLKNGLNIANIFRTIFKSHDKTEKELDADVEIRKVYNDEFFRQNLQLEHDEINDFIFYAEQNGLTDTMLKKGNELELIEFLINKSKDYNAQRY